MFEWIKSLFISKRLRAANARIKDLELQNLQLRQTLTKMEDVFLTPEYSEHYLTDSEIKSLVANRTLADELNIGRLDY